ncbi:hypothetical protein Tco_0922560 [Tanacetum coccineum]|uniref:Uncharacterized protein n=1 Tax=Tanacetum coccineum TaxID=301880 RepID=A0ABQ5CYJ4_9ASTR
MNGKRVSDNEKLNDSLKTPKPSKDKEKVDSLDKKTWFVKEDPVNVMRRSANKFIVLEVVYEYGMHGLES